jgi:hypothetical protein
MSAIEHLDEVRARRRLDTKVAADTLRLVAYACQQAGGTGGTATLSRRRLRQLVHARDCYRDAKGRTVGPWLTDEQARWRLQIAASWASVGVLEREPGAGRRPDKYTLVPLKILREAPPGSPQRAAFNILRPVLYASGHVRSWGSDARSGGFSLVDGSPVHSKLANSAKLTRENTQLRASDPQLRASTSGAPALSSFNSLKPPPSQPSQTPEGGRVLFDQETQARADVVSGVLFESIRATFGEKGPRGLTGALAAPIVDLVAELPAEMDGWLRSAAEETGRRFYNFKRATEELRVRARAELAKRVEERRAEEERARFTCQCGNDLRPRSFDADQDHPRPCPWCDVDTEQKGQKQDGGHDTTTASPAASVLTPDRFAELRNGVLKRPLATVGSGTDTAGQGP